MSKLDGIKADDRVRALVEGVVKEAGNGQLAVYSESGSILVILVDGEITDHLVSITRIEPALAVGDRVRSLARSNVFTLVGFLSDGRAICEYEAGDTTNVCARDISCLTHA